MARLLLSSFGHRWPTLGLATLCLVWIASPSVHSQSSGVIAGTAQDERGRPLQRTAIYLFDEGEQIVGTRLSEGQGQFEFAGLAPGRYIIKAKRDGYGLAVFGATTPGSPAQLIEVSARSPSVRIQVRLFKNASVSGRVLDSTGEPIIGAEVIAARSQISAGRRRLTSYRTARTDDRGEYRLVDLVPASYSIVLKSATSPESSIHYPTLYFPNTTSADSAVFLTLGAAEQRPGTDFVVGSIATYSVSGAIDGINGNSGGLSISLRPTGRIEINDQVDVRVVPLDLQGRFVFHGVAVGTYVAEVVDASLSQVPTNTTFMALSPEAGFASPQQTADRVAALLARAQSRMRNPLPPLISEPPRVRWLRIPVRVQDSDVNGLRGRFEPGHQIVGSIVFNGDSPKPTAEILAATPVYPVSDSAPPATVLTGISADFTFRTMGLAPGAYQLTVLGRFPGWTFSSISVGGRDLGTGFIDVDSTDVSGLVLTYVDRPARLSGRIAGSDGKPAPSAIIYLFPADRNRWSATGMLTETFRQVRASSDGQFQILIAPGEYLLVASAAAIPEWQALESLQAMASRAVRVHLERNEISVRDLRIQR